ncbi:MAG: hypothetical protein QM485_12455 [Flavobacteriaceae bacterium]
MKGFFCISLLCLVMTMGYAHEADEAFFKLTQKEATVEIEAEFPWSLRNALIAFDPSLATAKDKSAFENAFIAYLKANLILKNKDGRAFEFVAFTEIRNNGRSRQNTYVIAYKGSDLQSVYNTLLFNINAEQKNYHSLLIGSKQQAFVTTKEQEYFEWAAATAFNYWWFVLILPVVYGIRSYYNGGHRWKRKG